jgi:lipoate-protein ligase A
MKFFNLGDLDWKQTQLIYHALAYENIESLVINSPKENFICVGLSQDPRDELDINYCKKNNIGIFRREIGGGTVLLDNNQLFYNLILNRNNPIVPRIPKIFFQKFLQPVLQTYHEFGISAEYRPLCDLIVNEKKISGNGGGEIGECKVLAGNIILDFNYEVMAKAILSPDSLREKFLEMMHKNITTVKRELDIIPKKEEICSTLSSKFENLLGPMKREKVDSEIVKKMTELDKLYTSDKWLYQRGTNQIGREIKVREGVFLFQNTFDTNDGNYGVTCEIDKNLIKKVTFTNDHLISDINKKKFKEKVIGLKYDRNIISNKILELIKKYGVVNID